MRVKVELKDGGTVKTIDSLSSLFVENTLFEIAPEGFVIFKGRSNGRVYSVSVDRSDAETVLRMLEVRREDS